MCDSHKLGVRSKDRRTSLVKVHVNIVGVGTTTTAAAPRCIAAASGACQPCVSGLMFPSYRRQETRYPVRIGALCLNFNYDYFIYESRAQIPFIYLEQEIKIIYEEKLTCAKSRASFV